MAFEIKDDDLIVTVDDSPEAKEKVWEILLAYFKKYGAYCGETIGQSDDPQIYAPETLGEIADIIFKTRYE